MPIVATKVLPSASWPRWFAVRQNIDHDIENQPYINTPGSEFGNNEGCNCTSGSGMGTLIPGSETLSQYLRRSRILEEFCGGMSLADLENETKENTTKLVASLDDRNSTGILLIARGQCRPYKGPLTQYGLYQELKRKRYGVDRGIPQKEFECQNYLVEPSAERRLIYIINLDRWSIAALIATASRTQIQALGNVMENYLAFRALMRVTISSSLPRTFALEFHLPYYALHINSSLVNDSRKRSDGSPLRCALELPLPDIYSTPYQPLNGTYYLYEAQISIAVIGLDRWTWIAYAFDDTYFEYDTLERCAQFMDTARRPDPLALCRIDADEPVWTPREYFLTTLEIRSKQVTKEWQYIVQKLYEIIKQTRTTNESQWSSTSSKLTKPSEQSIQYTKWNIRMTDLLRQLIDRLSSTYRAWDVFEQGDFQYFSQIEDSSDDIPTVDMRLRTIQSLFQELKGFEQDLQDLKRELSESFKLQASIERMEIMKLQQRDAEHGSLNAAINVIFFPVVMTVGICSAAPGVLPFKPSFSDFLMLILIFSALMFGAQALVWRNRRSVSGEGICARLVKQFCQPRRVGGLGGNALGEA